MENTSFTYPRSPLDNLITEKALAVVNQSNSDALISFLTDDDELAKVWPLKNVCAKVSVALSDEIDEVVGLLGVTKRRFLEAAYIEAVSRAHAIMEREGVYHAIEQRQEGE